MKPLLSTTVLMLLSAALAGGAGDRAALPGTAPSMQTAVLGLSAADLLRMGLTPVLLSSAGERLATVSGPLVSVPAGGPAATHLLVTRGDEGVRYALAQALPAGAVQSPMRVMVDRASRLVVFMPQGALPSLSAPAPGNADVAVRDSSAARFTTVLLDRDLRPVATSVDGGSFRLLPGASPVAAYVVRTQQDRSVRHTLTQPVTVTSTLRADRLPVFPGAGTVVQAPAAALSVPAPRNAPPAPAAPPEALPDAPAQPNARINLCHRTSSEKNLYVQLSVSQSALAAHSAHGDLTTVPAGGCPTALPGMTMPPSQGQPGAADQDKDTEKDKDKDKDKDKGPQNGNGGGQGNGNGGQGNGNGNGGSGNGGNGNGNGGGQGGGKGK